MPTFNQAVFATILVVGIGSAGNSQAALYDRGSGLLYDDVLNITWLQDANYAATSGFKRYGDMTWNTAQNWVAGLVFHDSVRNVDYSDWRLPSVYANVELTRYSQSGSELSALYYILGGQPGKSIETTHNSNYDLFRNIQHVYWLGTEFSRLPGYAWYFDASVGYHELNYGGYTSNVWAVRDGDVAASIPEPSILWLFLSGFGLLAINHHARKANCKP